MNTWKKMLRPLEGKKGSGYKTSSASEVDVVQLLDAVIYSLCCEHWIVKYLFWFPYFLFFLFRKEEKILRTKFRRWTRYSSSTVFVLNHLRLISLQRNILYFIIIPRVDKRMNNKFVRNTTKVILVMSFIVLRSNLYLNINRFSYPARRNTISRPASRSMYLAVPWISYFIYFAASEVVK